jgi:hypothetical protein
MYCSMACSRAAVSDLSTVGVSCEALPPSFMFTRYMVKCAPLAGVMRWAVRLLCLQVQDAVQGAVQDAVQQYMVQWCISVQGMHPSDRHGTAQPGGCCRIFRRFFMMLHAISSCEVPPNVHH